MAYKTDWKLDDIVKPEDMNRIEGGLEKIDGDYVPLSGGTLDRGAKLTFLPGDTANTRKFVLEENGIKLYSSTNSGWANGVYFMKNDDSDTIMGGFGGYGGGNSLTHLYIGDKYNEPWCKFTSDGTVKAKLFDGGIAAPTIPNNTDLNELKTPGRYEAFETATVSSLTNIPDLGSGGFILEVINSPTNYYTCQILYGTLTGRIYKRRYTSKTSSWSDWARTATYEEATSLTNLGITATATELNYMDGVTSAVQTQLNAKATTKTFTATIPTTGWTTSAPYKVMVGITGVVDTDKPMVTPVYTGTLATDQAIEESWNLVDRITTGSGGIWVYAFDEVPTTAIPIQLQVVR